MPTPDNRIPAQNVEENAPVIFNAIHPDKIGISFDDIGGMEELKQQARMKIIMPFKNPQLFKKFGKSAGGPAT